jgi:hypothetical protein
MRVLSSRSSHLLVPDSQCQPCSRLTLCRPVAIAPAMYPAAGTSPASTAPAPGGNLVRLSIHLLLPLFPTERIHTQRVPRQVSPGTATSTTTLCVACIQLVLGPLATDSQSLVGPLRARFPASLISYQSCPTPKKFTGRCNLLSTHLIIKSSSFRLIVIYLPLPLTLCTRPLLRSIAARHHGNDG